MAKPATKPTFGAGVLSGLRASASKAGGEPLFLTLDQIEEDPDQPRTSFDQAELEQLAETIRLYGVLTPVGVRKLEGERYRLIYGARRLRASRLAEQTRIPAVVLPEDKASLAVQVIENQARAGLSNRDLAAVVNRLFEDGMKIKQIAAICNLKDYQVSAFRSADKLPPFLAARLDHADMRALYDLSRAWEKHPAEVEATMPDEGIFLTVTEARRVIEAATGKATSSVFLDRVRAEDLHSANLAPVPAPGQDEAHAPEPGPASIGNEGPADGPSPVSADKPERPGPVPALPVAASAKPAAPAPAPVPAPASAPAAAPVSSPAPTPVPTPAPALIPAQATTAPVFIMETMEGVQGVLVTDARPGQPGWAYLDVQGERVEMSFTELRCVNAK